MISLQKPLWFYFTELQLRQSFVHLILAPYAMVNPLILFLMLNASKTLQDGMCFPRRPNLPEIIQPSYQNCMIATSYIPQFDKSHAPISFGRTEAAGYQVPKLWVHGDCNLRLDVNNADAVDTATFYKIQRTARGLTELCVKQRSPRVGGVASVGDFGALYISVFGLKIGENRTAE